MTSQPLGFFVNRNISAKLNIRTTVEENNGLKNFPPKNIVLEVAHINIFMFKSRKPMSFASSFETTYTDKTEN
jgi:hypothetical protein